MADLVFPERPVLPPVPPRVVEWIVRRDPLAAIHEGLGISIHHVVNDRRSKLVVADLYRATRLIEREAWLRREVDAIEAEAWIRAHL